MSRLTSSLARVGTMNIPDNAVKTPAKTPSRIMLATTCVRHRKHCESNHHLKHPSFRRMSRWVARQHDQTGMEDLPLNHVLTTMCAFSSLPRLSPPPPPHCRSWPLVSLTNNVIQNLVPALYITSQTPRSLTHLVVPSSCNGEGSRCSASLG
jgi:hypothetical protein